MSDMGRITVRTRDGRAFLEGWAVCVAVAAAVAYVLHGTVPGGAGVVLLLIAAVFVGPLVGGICQAASLQHARARRPATPDPAPADRPHPV